MCKYNSLILIFQDLKKHSLIRAQLSSKPWRTGGVISSKFFPTMDQQGVSSPLSNSCIVSVTNANYFSESSLNQQPNARKHAYQLDSYDTAPDKMQKMSDDTLDKLTGGLDIKSPTDGLKAKRYNRTAEALKVSGLMDITMKTAELLKKNKQLQNELDMLKKDSREFLQTVLDNPENHHLRDTLFSQLTSPTEHTHC